jgi:hypothetical protein
MPCVCVIDYIDYWVIYVIPKKNSRIILILNAIKAIRLTYVTSNV